MTLRPWLHGAYAGASYDDFDNYGDDDDDDDDDNDDDDNDVDDDDDDDDVELGNVYSSRAPVGGYI